MPGEPIKYPTKVCSGRSNSSAGVPICTASPVLHHHDLVGESQRLDLIVGDIDHQHVERAMDGFELRAQLPFERGIDHRQRLVEQHGGDVGPHQPAPERDLLLGIGGEAARPAVEVRRQAEQRRDLGHPGGDRAGGTPRFFRGNARFSATVMVS